MRTLSRALAAASLLAATAGLVGCTDEPASSPDPAPATTPTATTAPTARPVVTAPGAGSDGLTVRYLGRDGKVTTLPVEDFPRR